MESFWGFFPSYWEAQKRPQKVEEGSKASGDFEFQRKRESSG